MSNKYDNQCPTTIELNNYLESEIFDEEMTNHILNCAKCSRVIEIYHLVDECICEPCKAPDDLLGKILDVCEKDRKEQRKQALMRKVFCSKTMILAGSTLFTIIFIILFLYFRS